MGCGAVVTDTAVTVLHQLNKAMPSQTASPAQQDTGAGVGAASQWWGVPCWAVGCIQPQGWHNNSACLHSGANRPTL